MEPARDPLAQQIGAEVGRLDAFSTLIADLREAHQRLLAANERLQEMRRRREPPPPAA